MDAFDARYENAEELSRDAASHLLRVRDRAEDATWLVRRLLPALRSDAAARAGLAAEAQYTAELACPRCPAAELVALEDGEQVLEYRGGVGVELDRLLWTLEASGRVLEPPAAVALVSEVLHNAESIAARRPPAVRGDSWGHGEISLRSVVLGRDGFGRLVDARLVCSGHGVEHGPARDLCRAPELEGAPFGTPVGDVFSVAAILAYALLGSAPFAAAPNEPLLSVLVERVFAQPSVMPAALFEVLLKALSEAPADRFAGAAELRDALRTALPLELDDWRMTAEGLAELARTLSSDRRLAHVPDTIFATYPRLARPVGAKRPSIDAALVSFETEKALSHNEIADALGPLSTGELAPQVVLPKRISVVPRRPSRPASSSPPPPAAPAPGAPPASPAEAASRPISAPPKPASQPPPAAATSAPVSVQPVAASDVVHALVEAKMIAQDSGATTAPVSAGAVAAPQPAPATTGDMASGASQLVVPPAARAASIPPTKPWPKPRPARDPYEALIPAEEGLGALGWVFALGCAAALGYLVFRALG